MKKVTEISPGLLLHTTDHLGPNRTVARIEYELEVRKPKLVIFEIDFTGSTNLSLEGSETFHKKTIVEPETKAIVGIVNVIDPNQSWSLETKYTWIEENPGTVQPGHSKKEKLSEGIYLTTSRTSPPDTFTYHLSCEKMYPVTITLDCSKSVNISLFCLENDNSIKRDLSRINQNYITVIVPPYTRTHICSLVVKDTTRGYQLKTKWSWSENGKIEGNTSTDFQDENHDSLRKKSTSSSFMTTPTNNNTVAVVPHSQQDSFLRRTPLQRNSIVPTKQQQPRLKREEISPDVFLETEVQDSLIRAEIVYYIQVNKQTRITFEGNFNGSTNLSLIPSGGLICEAVVEPMRRMQVARLRVIDSTFGWKLVCRYKWQEEDILIPLTASPVSTTPTQKTLNTVPSKSSNNDSSNNIRSLLVSLNLEGYADFFEAEEVSLDLLKVMVRDEAEFRRNLEMIGVNKMGHRERILLAVKNLPVGE